MPPPLMTAASVCADQVADRGLARTHDRDAAVELDLGGADRGIELLAELALEPGDDSGNLGIGRYGGGVDDAELRPPLHRAAPALLLDVDGDIDRGDVVGVEVRFDHRRAAVVVDEEVVGVAGEDQVGCAAEVDLVGLLAGRVRHDDDEIGTFSAQGLCLLLHGRYRRGKFKVAGIGGTHAVVEGRAGQTDAHVADGHDRAVLKARHRLAVVRAQIGAVTRESGLGHTLKENLLAEIVFVVARYEDVGRYEIGEGHDVGSLVDARHQRG
jgi:hypothetical protein